MEASKWLHIQTLLNVDEMESLLDELGPLHFYQTGIVVEKGTGRLSKEAFLNRYKEYVDALMAGKTPDEAALRPYFTLACTLSENAVSVIGLPDQKEMIRIIRPVIMIQPHQIGYSPLEEKFRPMIIGTDSITWGVQFSYPQLFQEAGVLYKVDMSEFFPNTEAYKALQKWVRQMTIPTPFVVEGKKINVPMRLGKKCLSWINNHYQLQGMIHVATPAH